MCKKILPTFIAFFCCLIFPILALAAPPFDANFSLAPVLEKAMPAVVKVGSETTVSAPQGRRFPDPLFEHFFGNRRFVPKQEQKREGTGSGVIIDADEGYILTNSHVISGADKIIITLSDGRRYDAKLLGSDPETDIAILQIEADNLTEIVIGDSEKLRVGDYVFAIGSPFGLSQTVTSGIVSALGRSGLGIESYEDFIQTDASINRGNSGGALINIKGELIGINTAILGPTGGNIGIGFAIPVNMAVNIQQQLLETGHVKRGQLGIMIQVLTPELAEFFGVETSEGIIIAEIQPDSPAEKAGLLSGDVILSINDRIVDNIHHVKSYIGLQKVGEEVAMKVLRDGEQITIKATIDERDIQAALGGQLGGKFSGVELENFTDKADEDIVGIAVQKIQRDSHAYTRGLRGGDIIIAANRRTVKDLTQLRKIVIDSGKILVLLVKRGGHSLFIAL